MEIDEMISKFEEDIQEVKKLEENYKPDITANAEEIIQKLTSAVSAEEKRVEYWQDKLEEYKNEEDYIGKTASQRKIAEEIYFERINEYEAERQKNSDELSEKKQEIEEQKKLEEEINKKKDEVKVLGTRQNMSMVKDEIAKIDDQILDVRAKTIQEVNNVKAERAKYECEILKLKKVQKRLLDEPSFDKEKYDECQQKIEEYKDKMDLCEDMKKSSEEKQNDEIEKLYEKRYKYEEFLNKIELIFYGKDIFKEEPAENKDEKLDNKDEVELVNNEEETNEPEDKKPENEEQNKDKKIKEEPAENKDEKLDNKDEVEPVNNKEETNEPEDKKPEDKEQEDKDKKHEIKELPLFRIDPNNKPKPKKIIKIDTTQEIEEPEKKGKTIKQKQSPIKEDRIISNSKPEENEIEEVEEIEGASVQIYAKNDRSIIVTDKDGKRIKLDENVGISSAIYGKKELYQKCLHKEDGEEMDMNDIIDSITESKNPITKIFNRIYLKRKIDPIVVSVLSRKAEVGANEQTVGTKIGMDVKEYVRAIYEKEELPVRIRYDLRTQNEENQLAPDFYAKLQKIAKQADKINGVEVLGLPPKKDNFFVRLLKTQYNEKIEDRTTPIIDEQEEFVAKKFRAKMKCDSSQIKPTNKQQTLGEEELEEEPLEQNEEEQEEK